MLCEKLDCGILKSCQSPYQNSWFLVQKSQKKKYRLINAVMHINKIIIYNVIIFSNIEQFMKEFSELKTVSLVNMQSDYDQIALKKKSHNLTEFMTVLRLLQNCTLIQSKINSVAQFCRAMIQIFEDLILTVCCMFLDDIAVKEPQTDYDDKEILTKVHHYVLKSIQNLNKILVNVECAEECVSGEKSQFIIKKLRIVRFICELKECSLKIVKVLKIVKWSSCQSIKDV